MFNWVGFWVVSIFIYISTASLHGWAQPSTGERLSEDESVSSSVGAAGGSTFEVLRYPWREVKNSDVRATADPRVEADIRLYLIKNAQKSIDILTFDQQADPEVGFPLLQWLEERASQNVKVRFATSWMAQLKEDPNRIAERYMEYVKTRYPDSFDSIVVGGEKMWARGWSMFDGIHAKLLIIDEKIVLTTGRGHGPDYLSWLDTAVLFKGALVQDSVHVFNQIWTVIREENAPLAGAPFSLAQLSSIETSNWLNSRRIAVESARWLSPRSWSTWYQSFFRGDLSRGDISSRVDAELTQSLEQKAEVIQLKEWASQPDSEAQSSENAPTGRARILHNQLLSQMKHLPGQPSHYDYSQRANLLIDPILDAVSEKAFETREIKAFIFATHFKPKFKEMLIRELKRGSRVQILTNSQEAHSRVIPLGFSLGWYLGLQDLDDVLNVQGNPAPQCSVYAFSLKMDCPLVYSHRKFIVSGNAVFTGSDNLTMAGYSQEEVNFQFEGGAIAEWGRNEFDRNVSEHAVLIDSRLIRGVRKGFFSRMKERFSSYFGFVY